MAITLEIPLVTNLCLGWIATRPLNLPPSTKTGHRRSMPPAAYSSTPNQRSLSPPNVQNLMRSV